jgi:hypothetical protein
VPDPAEPSLPEPSLPEPSLPEPSLPEPSLSEPSLSEPSLSEPSLPEPSLPEPSLPEPSPSEPSPSEPSPSEPGLGGSASRGDGAGVEVEVLFEDHGSFAHGVCHACGWVGPGRRSRRLAARDADDHLKSCAPGRERLTARGRS